MFKQLNLEKPMKWFLNLASDKLSTDSPANKLRKYCEKYKNIVEWGKKYNKKENMQTALHDAFKKIFDERPQDTNASIENFLKDIKDNPETLGKKLMDGERDETDKEIILEELN